MLVDHLPDLVARPAAGRSHEARLQGHRRQIDPTGGRPRGCGRALAGRLPCYERTKEVVMAKRARKRKARKGKKANHGKRPNS